MTITVLLFASYADALGRPHIEVPLATGATVAQVVASVRASGDPSRLPTRPLFDAFLARVRGRGSPAEPAYSAGAAMSEPSS